MPFHLIVTLNGFDPEVAQGAMALVRKFTPERTIWINATKSGPDWVFAILMAPGAHDDLANRIATDVISFRDGCIYLIAHGTVKGIIGLEVPALIGMMRRLLAGILQIPPETHFDKLTFLVCQFGRLKVDAGGAAGAPAKAEAGDTFAPRAPDALLQAPDYLIEIAKGLQPYTIERVIAWNGWVTIFTFKLLARMVDKYQVQIAAEMERMLTTFSKSSPHGAALLLDTKDAEGYLPLPFHASMEGVLKSELAALPLEKLLKLVGRRMNETNELANIVGKRKVFSSGLPPGLTHPVVPMSFTTLGSGDRAQDARGRKALEQLTQHLPGTIARIIMGYEGTSVWVYFPGQTKVCLYNPLLALTKGLGAI